MILVTGGAGYIGSHVVLELLIGGDEVVVIDNFSNSNIISLKRVEKLASKSVYIEAGDITSPQFVNDIFKKFNISSVIHLAGFKSVRESVLDPLKYYDNNVSGTINLLTAMEKAGVRKIVFSSSATVYGNPSRVPINESYPIGETENPYGTSKYLVERILKDLCLDSEWAVASLRYFNPIGAHQSGQIGESPKGVPNNLVPYIAQVASGYLESLSVFGNDYPTPDGTGVRDYIHVIDLAKGHQCALKYIESNIGYIAFNLGTGIGYSVLDVIQRFEKISRRNIPFKILPRRPGDVAVCYADPSLALKQLNWTAKYSLEEMLADSWRWQQINPFGYA